MSLLNDFRRLRRNEPCPVCDHVEWCLVSRDEPPSKVLCQRNESRHRWKDAGWLHVLRDDRDRHKARRVRRITLTPAPPDFSEKANTFTANVDADRLAAFATSLGVTTDSLHRLAIGWNGRNWSFPMTDVVGRVRGIRLRSARAGKFAVTGSKNALFIPTGLGTHDPLLIAEGPTDTAAGLDLGFDTIGRPDCKGGKDLLIQYVKHHRPPAVAVISDLDEVGRSGAGDIARSLALYCRDVRVVEPWAADLREWLRAGATHADVRLAIEQAEPTRVCFTRPGGGA
ncbi:MAG: hypothetical protein ACF8R9_05505 [Phycisphaerales bacterium JB054]